MSGRTQQLKQWVEASAFEAALLTGDHHLASTIIGSLVDDGEDLVEIGRYVVQPSLYDVGAKWEVGLVTVAQEHTATAIAQAVMADAHSRLPRPIAVQKRALLGCVPGNHHAVGVEMVRDALQSAGWLVKSLGANAPTVLMLDKAEAWKPDIIGLSASLAGQIPMVKDVIVRLRKHFPNNTPRMIIGGLAFTQLDHPAHMVGADWYATDAEGAVTFAKSMVDPNRRVTE